MAIPIMIISGIFCALSNLFMRGSMEGKNSPRFFFIVQLLFTMLVTLFFYPLKFGIAQPNSLLLFLGILCGIALGMMKLFIGKALAKGSSSLTFATVNSACIMPALILSLLFSSFCQATYTKWNFLGSLLVIIGLFWAAKEEHLIRNRRAWAFFALGAFGFNTLYMVINQLRAFHFSQQSGLFVPATFAVAAGLHAVLYFTQDGRLPSKKEVGCGVAAGVFNGLSAWLFTVGIETASGNAALFIFPTFCISLICACNIWGQWLYHERVNWQANALAIAGLLIGLS